VYDYFGPKSVPLSLTVYTSPSANSKNPWWVKLVDEPTTPIDWSLLTPRRKKQSRPLTLFRTSQETRQLFIDYWEKKWPDWQPPEGEQFTPDIRHDALKRGADFLYSIQFPTEVQKATGNIYSSGMDRPEGWHLSTTPQLRGYVKWQGSPEENLLMCRVAGRFYGLDDVMAIPVDDHFLRVMWGNNGSIEFEFGDVDDFVITRPTQVVSKITKVIIPNKCKWYLQFTQRQLGTEYLPYIAGTSQGASQTLSYCHWKKSMKNLQEFVWALGYISLDNDSGRFIPTGATGTLSGAGELMRLGAIGNSQYGTTMRGMHGFLTDLPLAQTSPIDFGGREFCKTCAICAEQCPQGAISDGEPYWEARYPHENPGYLAWRNDTMKCSHCPICQQVCPFNSQEKSSVHNLIRATASTTSIFNGFFTEMGKVVGTYGQRNPNLWWEREDTLPFGYDSAR
jgi:reductive dehalogenase